MERQPVVYLLASRPYGTLYIGVTSNLVARVWQHQNDLVEGFTRRYGVHRLVWYELHSTMYAAIEREKQLKHWNRSWKIRLIEALNPAWRDLSPEIGLRSSPSRG
jgi:putative endonuclease